MRKKKVSGGVADAGSMSEVRTRCAASFMERIKVVEAIVDNTSGGAGDRLKALDLLGKYAGFQGSETGDKAIEPKIVIDFGSMTVAERREFLKELG